MKISEVHAELDDLGELFREREITRDQYYRRRAPLLAELERYYGPQPEHEEDEEPAPREEDSHENSFPPEYAEP